MEKIKEFMSNPKKTAILGLVGCALMLLCYLCDLFRLNFFDFYFYKLGFFSLSDLAYLFSKLYIIGLITYFTIVFMRIFKKKGNIKIANYVLIVCYVVTLLDNIVIYMENGTFSFFDWIDTIILIISNLYFFNILLRKKNFVNNKMFAIFIILYALYFIVKFIFDIIILKSVFDVRCILSDIKYILLDVTYISYIFIIPYFYNYYKLLKSENGNVSTNKKNNDVIARIIFIIIIIVIGLYCTIFCNVIGCSELKVKGGQYCISHTCKIDGCTNERETDSLYCYSHTCIDSHCTNKRVSGSSYCYKHYSNLPNCKYSNCSNKVEYSWSKYCDKHSYLE